MSVEEWACYSDKIIKSSEKKIKAARSFEVHVKILLGEIMNDLSEQYFVVNKVFQSRIEEVKEAKTKLEEQHYEVRK